jgi:hypothetical protein
VRTQFAHATCHWGARGQQSWDLSLVRSQVRPSRPPCTVDVKPVGPHHSASASASTHAAKTRSGGALTTRSRCNSRSGITGRRHYAPAADESRPENGAVRGSDLSGSRTVGEKTTAKLALSPRSAGDNQGQARALVESLRGEGDRKYERAALGTSAGTWTSRTRRSSTSPRSRGCSRSVPYSCVGCSRAGWPPRTPSRAGSLLRARPVGKAANARCRRPDGRFERVPNGQRFRDHTETTRARDSRRIRHWQTA